MIGYKSDVKSIFKIDPRLKLYFLLIGNLSLIFSPSLLYEVGLVFLIVIYGIISGVGKFTFKASILYAFFCGLFLLSANYMTGSLQLAVITFAVLSRKMFPCAMMGGILIFSTKVDEFMVALNKLHLSKKIVLKAKLLISYPNYQALFYSLSTAFITVIYLFVMLIVDLE